MYSLFEPEYRLPSDCILHLGNLSKQEKSNTIMADTQCSADMLFTWSILEHEPELIS